MAPDSNTRKKKNSGRSPNHPLIDLQTAIERVKKLYDVYGTHDVPVTQAHATWGYKEGSASGNQCVAALGYYGLLEITGQGKNRKVSITSESERILRNAPDKKNLIKQAALKPTIHMEVVEKYKNKGLPPDNLLQEYLVWERPEGKQFTDSAAKPFITRLRDTLNFAEISIGDNFDTDSAENESGDTGLTETLDKTPSVGDLVQWTSGGVYQFPEPRRVEEIFTEDGVAWAYIEGSNTAVEVTELIIEKPSDAPTTAPPEQLPHRTPPTRNISHPQKNGPTISFPLTNNNTVEIRLCDFISESDFERLKQLIDLSKASLVKEE